MKVEDMTPEQIARAKACQSPEEIIAVFQEEGVELDDSQLEEISGGGWLGHQCPKCGSYDVDLLANGGMSCDKCGYRG